MDIKRFQKRFQEFIDERNWEQFHNPKNLSMALAGEAGELLDVFQWLTPEESEKQNIGPELKQAAKEELADVFIYLMRLADKLDIDLESADYEKMIKNRKKYPSDKFNGTLYKYNR
ncbi:MAG: nucleotide pyrophosphohydrolase [Bacteroidales bacterium]